MTQEKKYDYAVYIGRFQPVHNGHISLIKQAGEIAHKVIIVCGSADKPRDPKNPWTVAERFDMLEDVLYNDEERLNFSVGYTYCYDYVYNNSKWFKEVQQQVHASIPPGKDAKICLIGHHKDDTSWYLDYFPTWDYVEASNEEGLSATDIRDNYFSQSAIEFAKTSEKSLPKCIAKDLETFRGTDDFERLIREYDMIEAYKAMFKDLPYPPVFVTTDAVVVYNGHILLITRGTAPGEGTLALPGGFIDVGETLEDGAIRELREETKLHVPVKVLKGSIKAKEVFDYPHRSLRGRTITHAVLFDLSKPGSLPEVRGSDDAAKAQWIELSQIESLRNQIFEDHADIIMNLVGRI